MRDQASIERILAVIQPNASDHFLELGAGDGALSKALLDSGAKLTAIELDPRWVQRLNNKYTQYIEAGTCRIIAGDMMQQDWAQLLGTQPNFRARLTGNLPYNISAIILARTMNNLFGWSDAHFLIQTEMAQRLTAKCGQPDWGRLAVLAHATVKAQSAIGVPPEAFDPPPKVQSTLVRIEPEPQTTIHPELQPFIVQVARTIFSSRRKSLGNSLKTLFDRSELLHIGLNLELSADKTSFADICTVACLLQDKDPKLLPA